LSKGKHRTETNCLNCGTEPLHGKFCHHCGQENTKPDDSFFHLVGHFFSDLVHFDGKFFTTLKILFQKPGEITKAYMRGRRKSFIDPIRMYIFTSAVFVIVVLNLGGQVLTDGAIGAASASNVSVKKNDSTLQRISLKGNDSLSEHQYRAIKLKEFVTVIYDSIVECNYTTVGAYDSIQQNLPKAQRDNFLERYVTHRMITSKDFIINNPLYFLTTIAQTFTHSISQVLILSLPIFSLILYILYFPKRKKYTYVTQIVYGIHTYCMCFIQVIVFIIIHWIFHLSGYLSLLSIIILLFCLCYFMYKSMRNFYGEGRLLTTIKFLTLSFVSAWVIFSLLIVFFIYAFFKAFVVPL